MEIIDEALSRRMDFRLFSSTQYCPSRMSWKSILCSYALIKRTCRARGIWEYGTMEESRSAWVCPHALQYTNTIEREGYDRQAGYCVCKSRNGWDSRNAHRHKKWGSDQENLCFWLKQKSNFGRGDFWFFRFMVIKSYDNKRSLMITQSDGKYIRFCYTEASFILHEKWEISLL